MVQPFDVKVQLSGSNAILPRGIEGLRDQPRAGAPAKKTPLTRNSYSSLCGGDHGALGSPIPCGWCSVVLSI